MKDKIYDIFLVGQRVNPDPPILTAPSQEIVPHIISGKNLLPVFSFNSQQEGEKTTMSNFSHHAYLIYAWTMPQEHRNIGDDGLLIRRRAWHICEKENMTFFTQYQGRLFLRRMRGKAQVSMWYWGYNKIDKTQSNDLCCSFLIRSTLAGLQWDKCFCWTRSDLW